MLVDADVSLADANALSDSVVAEFRNRGLISGELTDTCVLGGAGFRPGPSLADLYEAARPEYRFWELVTSGVEPTVERSFNYWALGESCEGFTCPVCAAAIQSLDDPFRDAMTDAIGEWLNESGSAQLVCPHCSHATQVTEWHAKPPLGFGNLSFRFWNWAPFDMPGWKIDIRTLVRKTTGHTIISTYGVL